ncbi:MAG: triose-phosphate isomerase [Eubacteriales bacterium]|nr:triose-phosphate isomerase [Eubacteriales bacterium]MDD4389204.1 triose-phosphate isomerase [Eubacteriales bacterium]
MRKPFIAGNWKMYKTTKQARQFAEKFKEIYVKNDIKVAICAPYTHLAILKDAFEGTGVAVAAQNMHFESEGAFTGEISAAMLKDLGVEYCIIGHSERRQYFAETDQSVNKKLHKAFETGILPIMCIGETLEEREAGQEKEIVKRQLSEGLAGISGEYMKELTVAYEPVWAIGTGRTATPEQANEMCGFIRDVIEELYDDGVACDVVIQYGGSVKPGNATEIMSMEEIDGALVGGASLNPSDFLEIVNF